MFEVTIDDGSHVTTSVMTREEIASVLASGGRWITTVWEGHITYISMVTDISVEIE